MKFRFNFTNHYRIDLIVTITSKSTLAHLGEFGLISRLTAEVTTHKSVITGIGDDAAITSLSDGMQLLTSTDMLLENVHFRRRWHDPCLLGRKSLAVSISDIAAMGGIPRWALLSIAIPADLPLEFIDGFMQGFLAMASENGVTLVGGDTCLSRSGVAVSVTIMGEQYPELIVRRSGSMPDDDIWVTGTLGDAALGLKLLEEVANSRPFEKEGQGGDGFSYLTSRLLDPTPSVSVAIALAEARLAHSMIDISDGVLADYGHIAEQSRVGGRIFLEYLPFSSSFRRCAADLPAIPYQLALSGGEDYELCFTSAPEDRKKIVACTKKCGVEATRIGIVTNLPGVIAVNPDGSHYSAQTEGFNHFT